MKRPGAVGKRGKLEHVQLGGGVRAILQLGGGELGGEVRACAVGKRNEWEHVQLRGGQGKVSGSMCT